VTLGVIVLIYLVARQVDQSVWGSLVVALVLAYLLAPPFLLSAWRRRKPADRAIGGPSVPLAEAMAPEPARIWSQGATAGHAAGRPGSD
jgi:hypothetical protein